MLLEIVTGCVLAVAAVVSGIIAWHQYRLNHSEHVGALMKDTIRTQIADSLKPVTDMLNLHTTQLTQHNDRAMRTEDSVKENTRYIRELNDKMNQMGVKVDMYWSTLEQLAMNAAKGMHQPDPARARLDHLLEAFVEGTLTDDERVELKKTLVLIRNYEVGGPPLDFPVHQVDQAYAVILLSTMDKVDPQRMAAMGHALHRSVRDKENRSNGNPTG